MSSSAKIRIGVFLVAGVVLFGVGLFLIGSRQKVFTRGFTVYADFSNIGGIVSGAQVRVSGLSAGQLEDIQVPGKPSAQYRLKLRVEDSVHPLIREDSMATIQTDGLVGDKYIEIEKGSDEAPLCQAGCTIPTTEPFDLSDLVQSSHHVMDAAGSTIESVGEVADNVNQALAEFLSRNSSGKNGPQELNATLTHAQHAMSNLEADTQAIQHNFLFRGFFHHRGYYSLSELTPDQYRKSKFVKDDSAKRVWLPADRLFAKDGKGDALTAAGKQDLDQAMDGLVGYLPNRPLIVEGYSNQGRPDQEFVESGQRAAAVEQYLEARFNLDPSMVGGIPLEDSPPKNSGKTAWDGVSLVVLP